MFITMYRMTISERIEKVFSYFQQNIPQPECFLIHTNPYTLLVAVVLSAHSTDKSVNKVMPFFINHADTPEKMVALGLDSLKQAIQTVGLYQRKASYIMELSHQVIDHFHSQVPQTLAHLITLPGVGRKTANVVLNVAFAQPTIPVDTHIFRVAHRLGLAQGKTPEAVEMQLTQEIPDQWKKSAHSWLILHGRTLCKARTPLCSLCPFRDFCPFSNQHIPKIKPK